MEKLTNPNLKNDGSELVPYMSDTFPLYALMCRLSAYPAMTFVDHWHDDLEFVLVYSGRIRYQINGRSYLLAAGHGLVVMPEQIHGVTSANGEDATYLCMVFPKTLPCIYPDLATAIERCMQRADDTTCILLDPGQEQSRPMLSLLEQVTQLLTDNRSPASTLVLLGVACLLLHETGEMLKVETSPAARDRHLPQLQQMLGFVHRHYAEPITLAQVAAAGALSKSACTDAFRRVLHLSPMSYVNDYRLERSMALLNGTSSTMAEIAMACGFCSASYFAELFSRRTSTTPTAFRKAVTIRPASRT